MSNILDQKGVGQLSIFVIKKSLFQEQMYDIIQLELLHIVFRQWRQWTVALYRGWLYGYLWCTYLYVYIRYAASCHFRPNQWQKVAYSPFGHKTTPSSLGNVDGVIFLSNISRAVVMQQLFLYLYTIIYKFIRQWWFDCKKDGSGSHPFVYSFQICF